MVDRAGPVPGHRPQLGPCWLFTGYRDRFGYGQFARGRKHGGTIRAYRFAWILAHGEIDSGLEVCHHCDNPGCVNPSHLFLGTHAENMADMAQKGRWTPRALRRGDEHHARRKPECLARGSKHGAAKLTEDQVATIRAAFAAGGVTKTELARRFNVTRTLIYMAVTGRTWKHVKEVA